MKNHLKRIATPRTWVIDRKCNTFICRPSAGAHSYENGLPLGIILRDILKLSSSMTEVKKLLNNNDILVDGKRRKNHHYIVGLFDVLNIPTTKKAYRIVFDNKGRIVVKECDEKESGFKICKIVGKTILTKGRVQYNLHDGKNIISEEKAKVGDSLMLTLPKLEIKEVLPLEKNVTVFLTKGKHSGDIGKFKEINANVAVYTKDKQDVETDKNYLFVIGKDKPKINFEN
jgi:small subunit ribosomal protein S4e